ncbi:MAG: hypothetical protein ITF98_02730 [Fermentimonas sp.]|nr:hypothetical protein [Fermentimonas sp.]
MSERFKKHLPDLIAIVAFIIISFIYFAPAVIDGRVISQHDSLAAIGQGQEQREFMERNDGERTRWNISMFSGMPSYQMSPTYNSSKPLDAAKKVYSLFLPEYVYLLFIMMLGFYLLMRAFKASPLISALGAIAWTFSSYFFILISAGHLWKFITLAYIPPTIAGLVYVYRKKYVLGGLLFMIFVAFQISSNHFQMSYYFLFVMLFMVIAFFVEALRKKELADFFKATGILLIAGIIGVSANLSNLYHTYEYSKETMRGKSELTHHSDGNRTNDGLERDYITAWSYGIGETWTLLVPNTKGGASVPFSENERAMSNARPEYQQIYQQIGQYWGDQPGTSGPVYVGAFILALFVLGLFIVKGPVKWALLAATVFSILLSWGRNFMGLTDFFIDFIPMYNKFRAVSSILVIAEFTIPLLAVLALKELITKPEGLRSKRKPLYISLGVTGGFALLFAIAPKVFFSSFISASEMQAFAQALPPEHIQPFLSNLTDMRVSVFTADAWRSFFIIAIGAVMLWLFLEKKFKVQWLVAGIIVLCLVDMWGVNKRYLNDSDFINKTDQQQMFSRTATDEYILQDTTKYYRVLNMATSTFNDGVTPYWHNTIGGYHAAKLRRYQDLIDVHISGEMMALQQDIFNTQGQLDSVDANSFKVINMLNTKWVIMPAQDGSTLPVENPHAMGNAWFVDRITFVDNADEEIAALTNIDLKNEAVAHKEFESVLEGFDLDAIPQPVSVQPDSDQSNANQSIQDQSTLLHSEIAQPSLDQPAPQSTIKLVDYDSDYLIYEVDAIKDELAIFSDVYYPKGWQVSIDGEPAEMIRANYILRALAIPAGAHKVQFRFEPQSIKTTDGIAYAALLIMLFTLIYLIYRRVRTEKLEK